MGKDQAVTAVHVLAAIKARPGITAAQLTKHFGRDVSGACHLLNNAGSVTRTESKSSTGRKTYAYTFKADYQPKHVVVKARNTKQRQAKLNAVSVQALLTLQVGNRETVTVTIDQAKALLNQLQQIFSSNAA